MAERVADQVRDDHVEAPRVDPAAQFAGLGEQDVHRVQPGAGGEGAAEGLGEVDVVQLQGRRARVEAGDLHQVVHQAGQLHGFLADEPYGRGGVRGQAGRILVEDVGHRRHRGQRGAQLVRHVRDETAGTGLHAAQFGHGPLQRGRGLVEGVGKVGEFVGAVDGEPGVQVPLGDPPSGAAQLPYRTQHAPGGQQGEQDGQAQGGQDGATDGGDQGVDVTLFTGLRYGQEDRDPGGRVFAGGLEGDRQADDERGAAGRRHPLEDGGSAGAHGRPHGGCQFGEPVLWCGSGPQFAIAGQYAPVLRRFRAGHLSGDPLQVGPGRGVTDACRKGVHVISEAFDHVVLALLEHPGAGLPEGQGACGQGGDGGDEHERHEKSAAQAAQRWFHRDWNR